MRGYRDGDELADRLVGLVRTWDAAGRPGDYRLRITARRIMPEASPAPGAAEDTRQATPRDDQWWEERRQYRFGIRWEPWP